MHSLLYCRVLHHFLTITDNYLGVYQFTQTLLPKFAQGGTVLFVMSGTEDPEQPAALKNGFRGGRYISAQACARGEFLQGGSKSVGYDAYATSKQCELAYCLELAQMEPQIRSLAVEPGFNPGTALYRKSSWGRRLLLKLLN